MAGYIGPVGGLESLWFTNSEPESVEPRIVKRKALSGRVTAQRLPRQRREWSCGMGESLPEDYATLEWMSSWPDPLVWYSALACKMNILPPAESHMLGATWGGSMSPGGAGTTPDGTRYLGSMVGGSDSGVVLSEDLPVPSEHPVAVSAYVSTHPGKVAWLHVTELDPEGAEVGTAHVAPIPADTHAHRASVTITTDVRTVAVRIMVTSALMVTLPAATLTSRIQPWATGRGCRSASIDLGGESHHFGLVAPDGDMRVSERSFTIHELG